MEDGGGEERGEEGANPETAPQEREHVASEMKNGVFWDVTPCDSCKDRHFRGT
jgi:hypothetical protein